MLSGERLAHYPRVIVELGMGDGRLLQNLARADGQSLYLGIEIDREQCEKARCRISAHNAMVAEGSIEDIVPSLPAESVDTFIAVLPDPAFIDQARQESWKHFYAHVRSKLKAGGTFQLITELTDDLLQPVSDDTFAEWARWLEAAFSSLGFKMTGPLTGAPAHYSSRCLDQFRGDPERIRIITMNFVKI